MIDTKFAVIGVGKFGAAIAKMLAAKGAEVFAFDCKEEKIENIKDEVAFSVTLDSTDKKALLSQNIDKVDAAVVSIGENFEAVILTTVHLLELGVKRVIARASGPQQKMILKKIGVTEILTPEDEVALVTVEKLLNPSLLSFLQLPDGYEVAEVIAPKAIANKTVAEIGLRDKYRLTLITLERETEVMEGDELVKEKHIFGVPNSDTVILETDTIIVFGTTKDVERFIEINQA